jgi:multidrug efflux pump
MFELAGNKEAIVPVFNPPPIVGMSTTGGFEAYLQYKGSSSDVSILNDNLAKFVKAANARPELKGVMSTFSYNSPQYYLSIDNENVKSLGINISDVFLALKSNLGGQYVNDFTLYGRNYRVYLLAESSLRKSPDDIKNISVKSKNGKMVSLASLVDVKRGVGTDEIDRFNLFTSAKIMGAPAPGYSIGQALKTMQEVAAADLPADFSIGFTGEAYEQLNTSDVSTYVLLFGIVMVFLILAALYERWSLPFAVIFIIPIAIFGALVFTFLRGLYNDIYFQVGLLTLIGLSSKNAILIVEFAMLEYHKGVAIQQAIITATRMRFRAIIMTSAAFILGCVPLYTSTGAGSASRHAVGTGVIGGMLASTFIATFFVPLFFKLIMQLSEKFHAVKKSGEANV